MGVKASYLVIAHERPGRCEACRHANQDTADFAEGHLFCRFDGQSKQRTQPCNLPVELAREAQGPRSRYFFFDPFTGDNCTYPLRGDFRVLAENASYAVQESMQAMQAVIPADEDK